MFDAPKAEIIKLLFVIKMHSDTQHLIVNGGCDKPKLTLLN